MIAYIDICLLPVDLLASIKFITDKSELTKYPAPDVEKKISHASKAEKEWEGKAGKKQQHEDRKYNAYPDNVKGFKEGPNEFQCFGLNAKVLKTSGRTK